MKRFLIGLLLPLSLMAQMPKGSMGSSNAPAATDAVKGYGSLPDANVIPKTTEAGKIGPSAVTDDGITVNAVGRKVSGDPGGSIPSWKKYALVKIQNGVNSCVSASTSAAVFTGTGLDDGTSSGAYTGAGSTTYTAIVDGKDTINEHHLAAGGTGYVTGDTFTVATGSTAATGTVTLATDGAVVTYTLNTKGKGYSIADTIATSATTGVGVDFTIHVTSLVDTFKWQKAAGAFTENIPMTAAAQLLGDGISITFAAITGHTLTDQWVITLADLGCWQVNGVLGADAAADVTQDVTLFTLPAKGYINAIRVKPAVPCTGATTAKSGLGTASSNVYFLAADLDIAAAASDTNVADILAKTGSNTAASVAAVASIVTTDNNVAELVAGCAVDYWVMWTTLP